MIHLSFCYPLELKMLKREESLSGSTRLPKVSWDDMSCLCPLDSKLGPTAGKYMKAADLVAFRDKRVLCVGRNPQAYFLGHRISGQTSALGKAKNCLQTLWEDPMHRQKLFR